MLPAWIGYPLFGATLEMFEYLQPDPADIAAMIQNRCPDDRLDVADEFVFIRGTRWQARMPYDRRHQSPPSRSRSRC
jgi:hypothetical protein